MIASMIDFEVLFNQCEAVLWFLVAAVFAVTAARQWQRRTPVPVYHRISIVAFVFFGVSDIIESHTGAWWEP